MQKQQYAVIGLGRFGRALAMTLEELGHEVLAVDKSHEIVQELADQLQHVVQADASDEKTLRALGVGNLDVAVVSMGDLEERILTTLHLKDMGLPLVVAKANQASEGRILSKLGADRVVYPERDMGVREAYSLSTGCMVDLLDLSGGISVGEFPLREKYAGKTLAELDLRKRHNLSVLAIKRGNQVIYNPAGPDMLLGGDILVMMGKPEDLAKV